MSGVMTAPPHAVRNATRREFIVGAAVLSAAVWPTGCGEQEDAAVAGDQPVR